MTQKVCMGAMLKCSFGAAPSPLTVIPQDRAMTGLPAATIMDNKPFVNIVPFGLCNSPANPAVAAAIAASLGAVTTAPCIPVTPAPWVPGAPTVLIGNKPALTQTSKCMCSWGGVIEISQPGQTTVNTP
jgi:hypothetical protein